MKLFSSFEERQTSHERIEFVFEEFACNDVVQRTKWISGDVLHVNLKAVCADRIHYIVRKLCICSGTALVVVCKLGFSKSEKLCIQIKFNTRGLEHQIIPYILPKFSTRKKI